MHAVPLPPPFVTFAYIYINTSKYHRAALVGIVPCMWFWLERVICDSDSNVSCIVTSLADCSDILFTGGYCFIWSSLEMPTILWRVCYHRETEADHLPSKHTCQGKCLRENCVDNGIALVYQFNKTATVYILWSWLIYLTTAVLQLNFNIYGCTHPWKSVILFNI